MDTYKEKNKCCITYDLIKKSLNENVELHKSLENINVEKIIEFSIKFENFYNILFSKKHNCYLLFKRNIMYFIKYIMNRVDIKFKKNNYKNTTLEAELLYIIIPLLKIFICQKLHKNIIKIISILIKFSVEKIFSYELFIIIIEILLNSLTNILQLSNNNFYYINDEPFNIINDMIIALISYPEEIKIENSYKNILIDIINLFDKYLFSKKYSNIIFNETNIWFKLLENHIYIPINQRENPNNKIGNEVNNKLEMQKKLFSFLIKIYKFSMRNNYMENIIIKNSMLELNNYLNSLNFLKQLFYEEIETLPLNNFKIKDGIFIPKNKFIFFDNIKSKSKLSEISIIFSFKLFQMEQNKIVDILEIYDNKKKSVLKLYINEKGFLTLDQNKKTIFETSIKIQENFCYFLCISFNNSMFNGKLNLFVDGDNKFNSKKISNLEFSKELSLALGKENYFGIIGEFLIINKALDDKKIDYLFYLKEDYANILKKINNNFIILPKRIKPKYKIYYHKLTEMNKSKEVFIELGYEIIFEINPNDLLYAKSKYKYIDLNNENFLNNNKDICKDNLEKNVININNQIINDKDISDNNENSLLISKKNIKLFKRISEMNYAYDVFYQNNGIDFLSFQLYNIFSKTKDIKLLNLYLYETISFIMNLFYYYEENFIQKEEKPKLESEMIIFFLTLLTLLKKHKENFYFNNNMILCLIELYEYFNRNRLINEKNIILSILLDIGYYKNKEDIFKYQQIFAHLKSDLESKEDNLNIFNKEILYKLLILDFCFESKEFKHKLLTEIISRYISFDDKIRRDNPKLCKLIQKEFISYILSLKSEIKIYHYLKIIYCNFGNIRNSLINDEKFCQDIKMLPEKINYKHCKYCAYNQFMFYLINQELLNLNDDTDKIFQYSPYGFMVKPSFLFLKCFISQLFNLSNEHRIKFIKMNSDPIEFIFTLIKEGKSVLNFEKFSKKFENIILYLQLLIEQMDLNDINLLDKIFFSFKLIIDFLKRIAEHEVNILNNGKKDEDMKQKNEIIIKDESKNLQNLLTLESVKNFFDIYININYSQAMEELKYFVNISIEHVIFPFYFLFLFKKYVFNDANSINNNKFELFDYIVDVINKRKIIFDIKNDEILIKNIIVFLICIYNLIINNNEEINPDLESILLLFLNHLKDINLFNCKYIFDLNLKLDKENKEDINKKKFILEMVSDIYFHFYERSNFNMVYQCLIRGIFLNDKMSIIFQIDNENFLEEKNRGEEYNFYNNKSFSNIADGEERQDIIFSLYFIEYLLKRLDKYKKNLSPKEMNKFDDPINFVKEILQSLLNNSFELFRQYSRKITYTLNNLQKINIYKSYINLFDFIKGKYKQKNFSLDKLIEHFKKLVTNKQEKFKRKEKRKKTDFNNLKKNYLGINIILKNNKYDINKKFDQRDYKNIYKLSFPKIDVEKKRNNSLSYNYSKTYKFSECFGFIKNKYKNDLEQIDLNNKKLYLKIEKIRTRSNSLGIYSKRFNSSVLSDTYEKNRINTSKDISNINLLSIKLNEINIPFLFYKKYFHSSDSIIMKQLFNPKEYYIWNKFNIILKNIIYSQKKFIHLSNLFKIKFRSNNIIKSTNLKNRNFRLKYPVKLKNFICDDYYRPFIKPDLNFFESKLIDITHQYLNSNFLNEYKDDMDKINKIQFISMIPINYDDNSNYKIVCEIVDENGSYFGYLYINYAFLLFINDSEKDPRKQEISENLENEKFYLYSFFLDERITNKNKNVLIYHTEIKEIVIRRFCFNYIGYEIFLKSNKSYLINFFNEGNSKKFIKYLVDKLDKNNINNISNSIINLKVNEDNNFNIVKNSISYFEQSDFRNRHLKGEISNFKYLLLLNKYSSRSYHDIYQYLILPLLYMDIEKKFDRDLSKPIALNKDPESVKNIIEKIETNYINFDSHFNSNYSTSGFVLYYLVRMNPFTRGHIKLQSNQFDVPERMFYTFHSFLSAMNSSEENRELVPEFFHNYEIFLNLNYINLGTLIDGNRIINDLNTGDKNGIPEFIIYLRQKLEKVNIIPWVDYIFGYYQEVKNNNSDIYNAFPPAAYEKNNNYELKKQLLKKEGKSELEIIREIKTDMDMMNIGIIPMQLFKNPSKKERKIKNIANRKETISKSTNNKSANNSFIKDIKNFLKQYLVDKAKLFLLKDNYNEKLIIQLKKNLYIFRLFNNENKNNIIKKELWKKKQIKLLPLSKMVCELSHDVFLSCRYLDKIMQINFSDKIKFLIYHENIVTSIEFMSHEEKEISKNIISHTNKIIIGDEMGYLNIIKIEYKIINKKQMELEKKNIKTIKNIKAHNDLIQGILFDKRLNIIISYSEEGQITINNAFNLNVLNIIELGNEFYIKDIKISSYDLIYILCTNKENDKLNYIKCFSLNGIKYTELIEERKIVNFFIEETLLVVYENNFIEAFNLYEIDGNPIYQFDLSKRIDTTDKTENKANEELEKNKNQKIILCALNDLEKKLIIIYEDHHILIEDVLYILLKIEKDNAYK